MPEGGNHWLPVGEGIAVAPHPNLVPQPAPAPAAAAASDTTPAATPEPDFWEEIFD